MFAHKLSREFILSKKIVLATINARYSHTSIGLRYLFANLKELQDEAEIIEFVKTDTPLEMTEKLLGFNPEIVGIGVYIWNATEVTDLIKTLRKVSPNIKIVLGGPEVSHLPIRFDVSPADYIIQGEGDIAFYNVCKSILNGNPRNEKIIKAESPDVNLLELPYSYYTDHDVANRVVYVEASRGCPFSCEFCLSSMDKNVRNFDLNKLLPEFQKLWERGARNFKCIDRTFNLKAETTNRILDFFLEKEPPYLVHFEVVPENFPESIRKRIKEFPPASLQLEVGIQTLNETTARNISRRLNMEKIKDNLAFLESETNAHLHVDLIIGLPGEPIETFAENLNTLANLTKAEIQLGILKKLSGTAISRHDEELGMVYSDLPPYDILKNDLISFEMMQKMKRLARFWDLMYNSGNFIKSVKLLWQDGDVYGNFLNFSEWIFQEVQSTYQISLNRLAELLFQFLIEVKGLDKTSTADLIIGDLLRFSGRKISLILRNNASFVPEVRRRDLDSMNKRQLKHL